MLSWGGLCPQGPEIKSGDGITRDHSIQSYHFHSLAEGVLIAETGVDQEIGLRVEFFFHFGRKFEFWGF